MKKSNIILIAAGLAAVYFLTKKKKRGIVEVGPLEKISEQEYNRQLQLSKQAEKKEKIKNVAKTALNLAKDIFGKKQTLTSKQKQTLTALSKRGFAPVKKTKKIGVLY